MYQVHIQREFGHAFEMGSLNIYILDDRRRLVDGRGRRIEYNEATMLDREHVFAVLPQEAAHALLAELSRTLGAVEHPEQLRHDYDAEKKRVDGLTDHLMAMNRELVGRIPLLGRNR